eukprot:4587807-Pyramimonas_sp.AAC.1
MELRWSDSWLLHSNYSQCFNTVFPLHRWSRRSEWRSRPHVGHPSGPEYGSSLSPPDFPPPPSPGPSARPTPSAPVPAAVRPGP